jgi:hypothetical protein
VEGGLSRDLLRSLVIAFKAVVDDSARWVSGVGIEKCVPRVAAATHWTLAWRRAKYGISFSRRPEAICMQDTASRRSGSL